MSLKNAIDGINRYEGDYFFSINIHPDLIGCPGLVNMCIEACRQLKDTRWKSQLVLEFSEKSDFYTSRDVENNLNMLSGMGMILFWMTVFLKEVFFFLSENFLLMGINWIKASLMMF